MKEDKEDPFASIMKFCKPTVSQEEKFSNCHLLREFEDFSDSNLDRLSSSPEPTPCEPPGIIILSPPDSQREDDVIYHTPPEEQNLDESSSDGARTVNLADGFDGKKRVGFIEGELNDEIISKENRVSEEELNGETVTIGETETIMNGINGNGDLEINTKVIDLVSTESVEKENIDEEGVVTGDKEEEEGMIGDTELVGEKSMHELDAGNEQDGLMKESDDMENVKVNTGERPCKKVNFYGSLDSGKVVGNVCVEMREETGVGGDEEFANVTEDENTSKDRCEDGLRRGRKNIEDIDKFRYVGGGEVGRGKKIRYGAGAGAGAGSRRELPLSMKGKERNVGDRVAADTVGTVTRFLNDCSNVLKLIGGDVDNSCEDADFLEIAKRQGLTFPRPRWWLPEGGDEQ